MNLSSTALQVIETARAYSEAREVAATLQAGAKTLEDLNRIKKINAVWIELAAQNFADAQAADAAARKSN